MKYPRPVMSISELVNEVGLPREYVKAVCHSFVGDKVIWHRKGKGKIYIDTEAFEKYRGWLDD